WQKSWVSVARPCTACMRGPGLTRPPKHVLTGIRRCRIPVFSIPESLRHTPLKVVLKSIFFAPHGPDNYQDTAMGNLIRIPTPLRNLTGNEAEVTVNASTVGEAIEQLEQAHSGIKARICDEQGNVRR